MPNVNFFSIPADDRDRARTFYSELFGWRFEVAWEYDTPAGREKMWDIFTDSDAGAANGGLTRREFPGQSIQVGIEVDAHR